MTRVGDPRRPLGARQSCCSGPVVGDASRVDRETICIEIVCRDQHNYFTTLNGDSSSSVSFNRVGERKKDNKKRSKDKTLAV